MVLRDRTVSELGERALIDRITARLPRPSWVVVGPGDDAAVIEHERGALDVLTTDAQVEGIHFDRRFVPPDAIGHRALAVNLSDLAAMGAKPRLALLSLILPDALEVAVIDGVLDGMLALAAAHHVVLVGGNISRSPGPLIIDVTATGTVRPRRALRRTGARAGDDVYVTGTIGDARVGLRALQRTCEASPGQFAAEAPEAPPGKSDEAASPCQRCEEKYLHPIPRVRAGMLIGRTRAASACMDLSDGLAAGVRQIAEASHIGIELDADALPITEEVRRWHQERGNDIWTAALAGGDDYELLFTVRPAHRGRLRAMRRALGSLPITRIGRVTKERRVSLRASGGEREVPVGFQHFR